MRYLLPSLLVIILLACSSPENKILRHVDSFITEHPDSALNILKEINRHTLGKDDEAYYALLYTQALIETKGDWSIYSDSLASIAFDKYGEGRRDDKDIRANYYLGRILFNQYLTYECPERTERTDSVLKYFIYAYEESKKRNDDYWRAKSAAYMAHLLHGTVRYFETVQYAQEAADYFKRAGMRKDEWNVLIRIASVSFNMGNLQRSCELLDSLYELSLVDAPVDTMALSSMYRMREAYKGYKESFIKAGHDITGREDPVRQTFRNHQNEISAQNAQNYRLFRTLFWIAIVVFAVIISFLIWNIRLHNRAHKAKMGANLESFLSLKAASDRMAEENADTISHLQEELEEKRQYEHSQNEIVKKLLTDKWSTLGMLCDELFDLGQSDVDRKRVVKNIEKELKKIVSPTGVAEIVKEVDTHMGGLVSRLREQCGFLSEADVNFIGLIYAGFSVRSVCMFTGMEYQYFYVKKSRLIKRIQNSDAPDKELFIKELFIERIQKK